MTEVFKIKCNVKSKSAILSVTAIKMYCVRKNKIMEANNDAIMYSVSDFIGPSIKTLKKYPFHFETN